jgi:WD40 repeat protein
MPDAATNPPQLRHLLAGLLLQLLLLAGVLDRPAAAQVPVRLDVFGDPLPEEAISRLGTVRFRHGKPVEFLQFTPDGQTLVSQGADGVRAWETATGKQIHALLKAKLGDGWEPQPLSADGKLLAMASDAGVRLWDVEKGRLLDTFGEGGYLRAAISPDGKSLAAARRLLPVGGVECWDRRAGQKLWSASPCEQFLQFAPDGKTVVVVGYGSLRRPPESGNTIRFLDAASGRERRRIALGGDCPGEFVFSADGRRLAMICHEGSWEFTASIRVWETDSGKELPRLSPPATKEVRRQDFTALAFTPDGKSLLAAAVGEDGLVLWDVVTGKERGRLGKGMADATAVAISADGKTVAVGFKGASIRVIDWTTGIDLDRALGMRPSPTKLAFTPDGRTVVTTCADVLVFWDAASGQERRRLAIPGPQAGCYLADDGRTAFIYNHVDDILIWLDLMTGKERSRLPVGSLTKFPTVKSVGPGGKTLAVGHWNGDTFYLLDSATGKQLQKYVEPDHRVAHVSFTADGLTLVAFHDGTTARVWDTASGARGRQLKSPAGEPGGGLTGAKVRGVVSPDGNWVAYSGPQGEPILFDVATGRAVHRFDQHLRGDAALAFSPDGRVLAWSSGADGIHLLETASGKERHTLAGHRGPVEALAFSADGTMLVSCSIDTSALVWDLTGRLAARGSNPPLSAVDLSAGWEALARDDAAGGYQAMRKLRLCPEQAVPYLRERLRPVRPVAATRLADLIADLDNDQFRTREEAGREIQQLGEQAAAACRAALAGRPSPEMRRRLQALVERQAQERVIPSAPALRAVRAVEALEAIGTKEARRHLEELAAGAPEARLTRDARTALDRLARRAAAP